MTYAITIGSPLAAELRKIGIEQINRAIAELKSPDAGETRIHQARKSFKRFRALLHLIKPCLGGRQFRGFDKRIRDTARTFGAARDSHVMLQTLFKINASAPLHSWKAVSKTLAAQLENRLKANSAVSNGAIRKAVADLEKLSGDFGSLRLDIDGFGPLAEGAAAVYSDCRTRLQKAIASKHDEAFHDSRKSVQRHWRHMQLLRPLWPDVMRGRAGLARNLAELLGEDHDIAVLRAYIIEHRGKLGSKAGANALIGFCETIQLGLREQSVILSERLLHQKPKAFNKTMAVYWKTAISLHVAQHAPLAANSRGSGLRLVSQSG